LVLDPTLLGTVPVAEGLKEDGVLLVNTPQSPAQVREATGFKTGKVFTVNASHIAIEEIGREITNTPMIGALAKATGLFEINALIEQTRKRFTKLMMKQDVIEANVRAMHRAVKEVQEG
jgi:pyruvate ferredoxin oxidoreductase gamma subunit